MTRPPVLTALTLTATAVAGGILAATPASAGGIGDFLSPALHGVPIGILGSAE
ncbi:hypothetical protein [Streptomyces alboniger]|uniref:hypothetical protein n=1 Tax=Streptomyces alboniger TaxID=132473 RepID=UPI00142F2281|nr:hypothetical protein [Streptomyces alboniger]